jgi:hypothetical protein
MEIADRPKLRPLFKQNFQQVWVQTLLMIDTHRAVRELTASTVLSR